MTASFFLLNLLNTLVMIYGASRLLEHKINLKDKRIYLIIIFLSLYSFFAYFITKSILRIIIMFQIYNGSNIYLFHNEKDDFRKITFVSLICFIVLIICEIIVDISAYLVITQILGINEINYFTNFLGFLVIIVFAIIISLKSIRKISIKIINNVMNLKTNNILICTLYIFIILTTSLYLIYFNLSEFLKFILLLLVFLEYIYLLTIIIVNLKNKEKIQKDLDLLIEITSKYENIIDNSRTRTHEDKNQLIVVKSLVGKDNNKAKLYLDSLIKSKSKDDDELLLKVSNIPGGGLKGLIYYKLLTMKDKKIDCCVKISKEISKNALNHMELNRIQDYYKIIGVFIDNAIEATEILNKKNKVILIEMYIEDGFLIFSISNEYNKIIDTDNLGKTRITTKGGNHGYGLQLVKSILDSNRNLIHKCELISNLFVQKIGIKIKD